FGFHTIDNEPYWTEDHYYHFTLKQIEEHIEAPTAEIHQLSLQAVEQVINSDELMAKFQIPEAMWSLVRGSWQRRDPSLYSRLDFAYDPQAKRLTHYVMKPIFSREGANISIHKDGKVVEEVDGPYGEEGYEEDYVVQQYTPLPKIGDSHVLIGSWLVNDTFDQYFN
ncbi:hypothetical protein C5468_20520, partial [Photorhabdus luminescens subsp. mexicana]